MMPPDNFYDWVFSAITNMLTANTDVFVALGQNLFRGLATIMIAWFGIKTALSAGEQFRGIHFADFASLVLSISFGFAMITYYSSTHSGTGHRFPSLHHRSGPIPLENALERHDRHHGEQDRRFRRHDRNSGYHS